MAETAAAQPPSNIHFFINLARAFGGAVLFSFPMLMTMEMWWLGFSMDAVRQTIFILLTIPLLIGLSYFDGFEDTFTGKDDIRETFVAYAVGFTASALLLFLFGVIGPEIRLIEVIGKIAVQAVPASLGAMFAQSLLGVDSTADERAEDRKRKTTYLGQLFLTAVGAVFLSMSVAPTEEVYLISYQMSYWHTVGLAVVTILMMHALFYAVEKRGTDKEIESNTPIYSLFLRFTIVGYAVVFCICFYILWTFGSIDNMGLAEQLKVVIVLAFPAALGGAASRLIL